MTADDRCVLLLLILLAAVWAVWHLRRRYHVTSWRLESGELEPVRCQNCGGPGPLADTYHCRSCERDWWRGFLGGLMAAVVLLLAFVGPVMVVGALASWVTGGNDAAEILGVVVGALGVWWMAQRRRSSGRWPWGRQ